jgi:hypothetical protein
MDPNDMQLKKPVTKQIGRNVTDIQGPEIKRTVKQWRRDIRVMITIVALVIIYLAYKEPKVVFEPNAFKLIGLNGVNIPLDEISEIGVITWPEMPSISIRIIGTSLFKVHRGKFKTTAGGKSYLSIYRGVSPIIRIVDNNGEIYFINRKNANETIQIFNKLEVISKPRKAHK